MRLSLISLAVLLFALPAGAVAPKDFMPARGVAMGGGRATSSGNESIFLNPAALGATRRYAVQLDYAHLTGGDVGGAGDGLVLSVVDSVSNPSFPTGLAFRYLSVGEGADETKGNTKDFALGFPLSQGILIGTHVTHLSYTSNGREFSQFTGDLGLVLLLAPLSLSFVGFNLIQVDSPELARGLATGVSLTDELSYRLTGEVRWEWTGAAPVQSYTVGAEYLLGEAFPIRAGYEWDKVRQAEYWSVGSGFVSQTFGFDVSYRHDRATEQSVWAFALKVFGN